jgi:DNA-binding GntR family transcriptional regulator
VHLYQVRATLESAASSFAAESASPAEVAALRDAYTVLVERVDRSQIDDLIELKNDFYVALIAASGNPIIGEMLGNVQARISQLRGVTLQAPGRSRHMTAELGRVVAAIEAADPKRAAKDSRAHVQAAEKIALRHAALSDSIIGPLTGATITDIGAAS